MDFSTSPLPAAVIATRLGLTGLATSAIDGTLTLTKTGTTARTATFPDAAIEVQAVDEEKSSDFTARLHATYIVTATCTVTDPTPAQGHEYIVFVRNGTCTIGGVGYIAGQNIKRSYHSGAWSSVAQAALGAAQTFSALQTFTNGLTVSAGTTALQAVTATSATIGTGAGTGTVALGMDGGAGSLRDFTFRTAGVSRWILRVTNTAESGSNAGSDWILFARDDAGGAIDSPISIVRAAGGAITLARPLSAQAVSCITLTASGSGVLGATALLASERLRVAGGTMGTPGATDVLVAAGKLSCGDTSAASIQTAGGVSCATLTASDNINMAGAKYVYLRGDASTDGSVRFSSQSSGTMLIEKRASGAWVSIGSFA